MVHWPKSQVAKVLGVVALALLVPLTFTLAMPLSLPMIWGAAAVLVATYYIVHVWRLRARAVHDLAVEDGFTFGDALDRMHEREGAEALVNARRREEFERTR